MTIDSVEQVASQMAEILSEVLGRRESSDQHLIEELGLDSIQLIRLVLSMEQRFGVRIALDQIAFDELTINQLAAYVVNSCL